MNKLGMYIAKTLYENNHIDKEYLNVYSFLFAYMLDELLFDIIAIISGIIFNRLLICICFLLVTIPLRQFAGGIHAHSAIQCTILSYSIFYIILFLCPVADIYMQDIWIYILLLCICIIIRLAPIDTKNKRLSATQKKKLHTLCIITLTFHLALAVIMWYNCNSLYCTSVTICVLTCTISIILGYFANRKEFTDEIQSSNMR